MTKETALTDKHANLGARMVHFAGFKMPVYYSGIIDEHLAVRESVGVFDVSHMGEFTVKGPNSLDFLQYLNSNDVARLSTGKVQYSCFPNHEGGIVDDLLIYMIAEDEYLLVVNAANIEKDWNWVSENNKKFNTELKNISDDIAQIAVQGPKASKAIQSLTDIELVDIPYYTFKIGKFAGIDNILISATGYTGSGGYEIYSENKDMPAIWDAVFEAGATQNIKPTGLGCRDTLRMEMGFCLYGNDINDTTSPIEAGLGWITKFSKDFISRETFIKQKDEGVAKKLVGFELFNKRIPRQHYEILNTNEEIIGEVTSGTLSPILNKPIAMGYVQTEYSKQDTQLLIKSRNKLLQTKVVKFPFYKLNS